MVILKCQISRLRRFWSIENATNIKIIALSYLNYSTTVLKKELNYRINTYMYTIFYGKLIITERKANATMSHNDTRNTVTTEMTANGGSA